MPRTPKESPPSAGGRPESAKLGSNGVGAAWRFRASGPRRGGEVAKHDPRQSDTRRQGFPASPKLLSDCPVAGGAGALGKQIERRDDLGEAAGGLG